MSEHPVTFTSAPDLPAWLPPDDIGVRSTRCGEAFDGVRVAQWIGAYALELLAGRSRGVIADRRDGVLYWLIPAASAGGWELPVTVYGSACYVPVPSLAPRGARGVHWLLPPGRRGPDRPRRAARRARGGGRRPVRPAPGGDAMSEPESRRGYTALTDWQLA
jgi:hypothetical protein